MKTSEDEEQMPMQENGPAQESSEKVSTNQ